MEKVPLKFEELKVGMKVQTEKNKGNGSPNLTGWVAMLKMDGVWFIEFENVEQTDANSRPGEIPPAYVNHTPYGRFWAMSSSDKVTLIEDVKGKKKKLQAHNWKLLEKAIIAEESKKEIIALLKQHENRDVLFTKWGLGEVIEYGKGMIMLFYGPPGTGKTHTARLIGKCVGKKVMELGSAHLQSSQPGQYERNLMNAFEEAKEKDSILFFDECDGMIQSRAGMGQIMSAENNCLLTEIEKFEGILILCTNMIKKLDEALERRVSLIVEFAVPDQVQRKQIWQYHLPKKMPLRNVNLDELSLHNLTGGQIKNAVLSAARLALSDGKKAVYDTHFEQAIKRIHEAKSAFHDNRKNLPTVSDKQRQPTMLKFD